MLLIYQCFLLPSQFPAFKITTLSKNRSLLFSLIVFGIGIIVTLPYRLEFGDIGEYIRKCIIFLLLPLLVYQLRSKENHNTAITSLLIGLFIAISYAFYNLHILGLDNWNGQRVGSFWDIGRWSEILGYIIAILVPFSLESQLNKKKKCTLAFIIILCILCLLLSGGRGPILGLAISLSAYLLFRRPKVFIIFLACVTFLTMTQSSSMLNAIIERIGSIFDITTQDSNVARITMWKLGVSFIYHNLGNDFITFLFGTGISHFETAYSDYVITITDIQKLPSHFSFSDMHNTYLDLAIKLGAIYMLSFLAFLFSLVHHFFKNRFLTPSAAYSGIVLTLTYSITAIFYTSGLEFQTSIFLTLIALCYANATSEEHIHER